MSLYAGFIQAYQPNEGDTSKATFDPDTTRLYLGLKRSVDALEKDVRGQVFKEEQNALNRNIKLQTAMAQVRSREFTAQEALSGRLLDTIRADRMKFDDAYNNYNQNTSANIMNKIRGAGMRSETGADALQRQIGFSIARDPEGLGRNTLQRAALLRDLMAKTGTNAIIKNAQGRYELGPVVTSANNDAFQELVNTLNAAEDLNNEFSNYEAAIEQQIDNVANKRSGATAGLAQVGNEYKNFADQVSASGPSAEESEARLGEMDFAREKYYQDAATLKTIEASLMGGDEMSVNEMLREFVNEPQVQEWVNSRNFNPPPFVISADGRVRMNRAAAQRAWNQYHRELGKPIGDYLPRYGKGGTGKRGALVIKQPDGSTKEIHGERLMVHANDAEGSVRFTDFGTGKTEVYPSGSWTFVGEKVVPADPSPVERERQLKIHADLVNKFKNVGLTEQQLSQVQAPVESVEVDGTVYVVTGEGATAEVLAYDPQTGNLVEVTEDVAEAVRPQAVQSGIPVVDSEGNLIDPIQVRAGAALPDDVGDKARSDVRDQILDTRGIDPRSLEDLVQEAGGPVVRPVQRQRKTAAEFIAGVLEPGKRKADEPAAPITEKAAEEAELAADIEALGESDELRELETPEEDRPEAVDVAPTPAPEPAPEPEPAAIETAEEAVTAQATADEAAIATAAADQRARDQLIENLARTAATTPGVDANTVRAQIDAIRAGKPGSMVAGARALSETMRARDIAAARQEAAEQFAKDKPPKAPPAAPPTETQIDAEVADAIGGDAFTDEPGAQPPPGVPDQQYTGTTRRADVPPGAKARERREKRQKRRLDRPGGLLSAFRNATGSTPGMTTDVAALGAANTNIGGPSSLAQEAVTPRAIAAVQKKPDVKVDDEDEPTGSMV